MKRVPVLLVILPMFFYLALILSPSFAAGPSLKEGNELLFEELQRIHGLSEGQMNSIRAIFQESGYIGQGNPAITRHPMTPQG